jgi:Bacterial SCP ortholog
MPARKLDPGRLLAAVTAQRAVLGLPPPAGLDSISALGAACAHAVIAAIDTGLEPEREALRGAVIYTLDLLANRAPGRAVEVRVPPFGAIQCVEGPRHTRGTPPNVVEVSSRTWILLAAGRLSWAEAAETNSLQASGPRSDLASYLPLWSPRPPT